MSDNLAAGEVLIMDSEDVLEGAVFLIGGEKFICTSKLSTGSVVAVSAKTFDDFSARTIMPGVAVDVKGATNWRAMEAMRAIAYIRLAESAGDNPSGREKCIEIAIGFVKSLSK